LVRELADIADTGRDSTSRPPPPAAAAAAADEEWAEFATIVERDNNDGTSLINRLYRNRQTAHCAAAADADAARYLLGAEKTAA
jgi:hypothetical protein